MATMIIGRRVPPVYAVAGQSGSPQLSNGCSHCVLFAGRTSVRMANRLVDWPYAQLAGSRAAGPVACGFSPLPHATGCQFGHRIMNVSRQAHRQAQSVFVPDEPATDPPDYLREVLRDFKLSLERMASWFESATREIDEYDVQQLPAESELTLTLVPTYEVYDELIQSVIVTGPAPASVANPVPAQPAVPASTVAVQNVNSYPVNVVISAGTITAVIVNGITVGTAAGTYIVPSAGAISITYSVAPTWVWSYAGPALTTPQTFVLQLGKRAWNLTLPASQILVLGPMGVTLARNDVRQIIATNPGEWFLELCGNAIVRNRRH